MRNGPVRTLWLLVAAAACAAAGVAALPKAPPTFRTAPQSWLVLPGGAPGGMLDRGASEVGLIRRFGSARVTRIEVDVGEGMTEPGTVLYPNDPDRRIEILWSDPAQRKVPKRFQISGARSRWHTVHGITLGITLQQLQALNGRPFRLAGFGWDYDGTVLSWSGGKLQRDFGTPESPARVLLRLGRRPSPAQRAAYLSVLGDRGYSSALPAMQALDPAVYQVIWTLEPHPAAPQPEH